MATRTIPDSFPLMKKVEVAPYQVAKASIVRRMAQAQNYLWAKMTRVYGMHGREGNPPFLTNLLSNGQVQMRLDTLPDGTKGRVITSFFVPKNWCGGNTLKIQGRAVFHNAGSGTSTGRVKAYIYDLDEKPIGAGGQSDEYAGPTGTDIDSDWVIRIKVPQNAEYQCKVFITFTNGDPGDDTLFDTYLQVKNVSARYEAATAIDLAGETPSTTWANHALNEGSTSYSFLPLSTAFLRRILDNTLHMYAQRGPELCQTYLANNWHNTNVYTEVGRYTFFTPDKVDRIGGKLVVRVQLDLFGFNNVRVKLNGTIVQVFDHATYLSAAGLYELDFTDIPITGNQENTVTLEATSSINPGTDWGTTILCVGIWEEDCTTITAPNAEFKPLDESALMGDSPIVFEDDKYGRRAGWKYLLENDKWLMKNRLRHLVGDWLNAIYKRVDTQGASDFDPRSDWTRGDQIPNQPGARKNITLTGYDDSMNNDEGISPFAFGQSTGGSAVTTPFFFPGGAAQTYTQPGRRVGRYTVAVPPVNRSMLIDFATAFIVKTRARRLRPDMMSTDGNGEGPTPEEPDYSDNAFLIGEYDAGEVGRIELTSKINRPDYVRQWQGGFVNTHGDGTPGSVHTLTLRGRLPPPDPGAPNVIRTEGVLFEVEVCSVYFADAPLSQSLINGLP